MSNDWKAQEVIYEFDITSFLRKRCLCAQKCIFPSLLQAVSTGSQQLG
jgi:hypothetical protein